jgi:hypothetical protein
MKLSQLIGSLEKVRGYFGDVPVRMIDERGPLLCSVKAGVDEADRTFCVILSPDERPKADRN